MHGAPAGRRAFVLTLAAFAWAVALLPAALLLPVYSGTVSSSTSGTTSTTSTLVGQNGTGVLSVVALPAVLTAVTWAALYWKCSRGSRAGGWVAWTAIGLLGVFVVLGALTIGLFALPVAYLLGWAARLTPSGLSSPA